MHELSNKGTLTQALSRSAGEGLKEAQAHGY